MDASKLVKTNNWKRELSINWDLVLKDKIKYPISDLLLDVL